MNQRFVAATVLAIAFATFGCGGPKTLQLSASPDIPAATSTAKLRTTDNGNTQIDLVVEHLANPERVSPGAKIYMVWVRGSGAGEQPQSLGALRVDDNLKGKISAVTPLRAFELYITAEASQSVTYPMGKRLLYATVSMR